MRVLLVDDQDAVRETLAELLLVAGLDVGEARSAEEALSKMEGADMPEVLVTDVDLGEGMNGLGLGRLVHQRWPDLGVVYVTGRPWMMDGHELNPAERLIEKPCTISRLLKAIEAVGLH